MAEKVIHPGRLPLLIVFVLCVVSVPVHSQDWKDELRAEQSRNAARIVEIDREGLALDAQLKQVKSEIIAHNERGCTYRKHHEKQDCGAWEEEGRSLGGQQEAILAKLNPLAKEYDRLIVRNLEIAQKLLEKR